MRIILTAVLLAASTVTTALSLMLLPFFDATIPGLQPLIVATVALWVLFALSVLALRRVPARAVVVLVMAGSVALGGAAMAGPPNTSTDSARYAWDGIVANAGISPYAYAPADAALDGLRPAWLFPTPTISSRGNPYCPGERIQKLTQPQTGVVLCSALNRSKVPTIYPPASELFFAGVRLITGPTPQYWPMQLACLLMSLGMTALLLRGLIARGRDPRWAALWAWCPLVATEGITNSHIDTLGALLLVAATLVISSTRFTAASRPWLAGIALGAAISTKLIPVIGSFALLRRNPIKVILGAVGVFALLYVPYVIASGIGVLGYLPGYLSEEGYTSGDRFILISLIAPGTAALVVSGILIAGLAALTWWKSNPDDPWLAQLVMIGGTLLIVSPRYPWYALLLVPMIAMTGRWEWLAVPLALTQRMLIPDDDVARLTLGIAVVIVVAMSLRRAGPGTISRLGRALRQPGSNSSAIIT